MRHSGFSRSNKFSLESLAISSLDSILLVGFPLKSPLFVYGNRPFHGQYRLLCAAFFVRFVVSQGDFSTNRFRFVSAEKHHSHFAMHSL